MSCISRLRDECIQYWNVAVQVTYDKRIMMKIVMPANVEPELFAKVCFVVTIFQKSYVFNIIPWPDDAVYSDIIIFVM